MPYPFGLFDVDCLELAESGGDLTYRPRVLPIVPKLEQLYKRAEKLGCPLVFTTCCSGRMPGEGDLPGVLHVPLESKSDDWLAKANSYRKFYLAKKAYGDPKINFSCRAFDMFQDNENAVRLLQEINPERWVVFGNGFDLCVGSAVRGILSAGYPVDLIQDVRISSAGGTTESEQATIEELQKRGARIISLNRFMKEPL